MIRECPSGILYDRLFKTRPLRGRRAESLDPIIIPNVAGGWDRFLFGTEGQLHHRFSWVYGLFGTGPLVFEDRGLLRKGQMNRQQENLECIFTTFFRNEKQFSENPACIGVLGCAPLDGAFSSQKQPPLIRDKKMTGLAIRSTNERRGIQSTTLGLMESRRLELPQGLLVSPEKKLNKAIRFERWREIDDLEAGKTRICQHHHELQFGNAETADAIARGDFWFRTISYDSLPVRPSAQGGTYHHGYIIRLTRLMPGIRRKTSGEVGLSFNHYMMEEVYFSISGLNGALTKVATVWSSSFDANARYHPQLLRALTELNHQKQGG